MPVSIGLATLATATPALAYIDPGIATLLLQGIIGAVAAGILLFRRKIAKLLSLFGSKKSGDESSRGKDSER